MLKYLADAAGGRFDVVSGKSTEHPSQHRKKSAFYFR